MSDYPTRPCAPPREITQCPPPPCENRFQEEWRQEPMYCRPRQICPQPDVIYLVPLPYPTCADGYAPPPSCGQPMRPGNYPQPYRYPEYPSNPYAQPYGYPYSNYPYGRPGNYPDYGQRGYGNYPDCGSGGYGNYPEYSQPYGYPRHHHQRHHSQWNSYGGYSDQFGGSQGMSQFMQFLPMLHGAMGGGGRYGGGNNPMNMLRMFMPQMPF